MRCSNFAGQTFWRNFLCMCSSQSNDGSRLPSTAQETPRPHLSRDHCWRHFPMSAKNVWQTWQTWQTWHARKNQPFFACGSLRRRLSAPSDIDFPPTSGILVPYLRCETGQQPPGRRRIIRFRCRGPAASLSHAETSFASGFLPSTTTDFLAPRGNCVHHADRSFPAFDSASFDSAGRRGRISVSHQTDSRVPRTLAITPSRPSFFGECGRGIRSCSAHAVRGVNVRTTRTEKKE
jgi:hypothetical protein